MRRIFISLLLIISTHLVFAARFQADYDPLLVLVIMVKNEETVMRDTLQPLVDGGISSFLVLDTGSIDKTVEVTEQFFKDNNIENFYIYQEPFVNFAVSRNRALELTQECFPNAAFMLMIDAEWYVSNPEGILDFCSLCLERGDRFPSYLVRVMNIPFLDFYSGRLIRCGCGVQWVGAVHEAIDKQTGQKAPADIYFNWSPDKRGIQKTMNRLHRDREILLKEIERNPRDTRYLFYLARTCADLGILDEAHEFYSRRVSLVGWAEEDFIANYYYAKLLEKLAALGRGYEWPDALDQYLKAHSMRRHRAETLVAIADYYVRTEQMDLAFIFARCAVEVPYPLNDVLMVEKYIYDYYRYELLTRCCWYIGEWELGEWAAQKAVDACPDYAHAQRNLSLYQQRRGA